MRREDEDCSDLHKVGFRAFNIPNRPANHVRSLKWITGLRLPGLMRRPIWDVESIKANFWEIAKIFVLTPQAAGFGRGYKPGRDVLLRH